VHLQQVLDKLSSVQLIVQMLKQEHIRGNPSEMSPKWMEADLGGHKSRKATKLEDFKRRIEGNIVLVKGVLQLCLLLTILLSKFLARL
jgi:hypothetical protein